MKNILKHTALALILLSASSCLKDQHDLFDKTASARMQEFIENARTVLNSPQYGWRMEYFTHYGGYNYAVKFEDGQVTASSELKPGQTETSYYKLINDNGPVLSFDTHNEILHFFATPSSSEFEARGGDFEFIILSAEPDEVVLKGKRSGYIAHLYPLEQPVEDFTMMMAEKIKNLLVLGFECDFNGDTSLSGRFDLAERMVVFGHYDQDGVVIGEEIAESFIYTETGVKLYEPLDVEGYTVSRFDIGDVPGPIGTDNDKIKLTAKPIPDSYLRFEEYPGKYSLSTSGASYTIDLEVYDEFDRVFEVKGMGNYEFFLYYDINTGNLEWMPGFIHQGDDACEVGNYYLIFVGVYTNNRITTSDGMIGRWNGSDKNSPLINFVSSTERATVQGFCLWEYNGALEDPFGEQYKGKDFTPPYVYPTSMRKIN